MASCETSQSNMTMQNLDTVTGGSTGGSTLPNVGCHLTGTPGDPGVPKHFPGRPAYWLRSDPTLHLVFQEKQAC